MNQPNQPNQPNNNNNLIPHQFQNGHHALKDLREYIEHQIDEQIEQRAAINMRNMPYRLLLINHWIDLLTDDEDDDDDDEPHQPHEEEQ